MKKFLLAGALAISLGPFGACQQSPGIQKLDVAAFESGYTSNGKAQLIDVRTTEEFAKGYLQGAVNMDWNSNDFKTKAATLDKAQPVYVYCLSGGRSASAAKALGSMGFKEVYDLKGGYMAWEGSGKAVVGASAASKGMSMNEFNALVGADLPVVVDFYAPWCAPCKKMMPMWEDLKTNNASEIKVVTIDSDQHREVSKEMGVREIPTIILLRAGKEVWRHVGLLEKADLMKAVAEH